MPPRASQTKPNQTQGAYKISIALKSLTLV